MRAFAALLVVYIHLTFWFFKHNLCGSIGVDLFFIISGFIISHSLKNIDKTYSGAIVFIKKRLRRLYPLYFTLTIVFAIILLAVGADTLKPTIKYTFLSIAFIIPKSGNDPVLFTGWSLEYELFFYFCVAVSIAVFRGNFSKYLLGTLFVLGIAGLFFDFHNVYLDFLISPFFLEFGIGFLIQSVLLKYLLTMSKNAAILLFAISILAFIVVGFGTDYGYTAIGLKRELIDFNHFHHEYLLPRSLFWGLPCATLFISTILIFRNTEKIRFLEYLGDISYSIYLVQVPVIYFYNKLMPPISNWPTRLFGVTVSFIIIIAVSSITYNFIERRAIKQIPVKPIAV